MSIRGIIHMCYRNVTEVLEGYCMRLTGWLHECYRDGTYVLEVW